MLCSAALRNTVLHMRTEFTLSACYGERLSKWSLIDFPWINQQLPRAGHAPP